MCDGIIVSHACPGIFLLLLLLLLLLINYHQLIEEGN